MYTLGLVFGYIFDPLLPHLIPIPSSFALKTALKHSVYLIFCEIQCAPKITNSLLLFVASTTFTSAQNKIFCVEPDFGHKD